MEVTSSKDPGNIDVQELTFLRVPPKLLAGAKLVSLHIQIDKLTSKMFLQCLLFILVICYIGITLVYFSLRNGGFWW